MLAAEHQIVGQTGRMKRLRDLHDNACLAMYDLLSWHKPVAVRVSRTATLLALVNALVVVSVSMAIWPVSHRPSIFRLVGLGITGAIYARWIERRLTLRVHKLEEDGTPARPTGWQLAMVVYIGMAFLSPFVAVAYGRYSHV